MKSTFTIQPFVYDWGKSEGLENITSFIKVKEKCSEKLTRDLFRFDSDISSIKQMKDVAYV